MKDTEGDVPGPCTARATDLEGVEASGSGAPTGEDPRMIKVRDIGRSTK